jgi:ketosteroid isomerase-like protein
MPGISEEQVRAQVRRFWDAYRTRSAQAMEQMYFPNAVVFSASARRSEEAQLVLARRVREFRHHSTLMKADVSSIDVQIIGNTAIAAYDYHFSRTKMDADGNRESLDVPFALGTQVFQLDPAGVLRIVHEHFSAAEEGKKSVLPKGTAGADSDKEESPTLSTERNVAPNWMPAKDAAISVEEVRSAVRRYWQLFGNKSQDEFEQMYSPSAIVFAAGVRRGELASLASRRRAREFFGPQSSVSAQLDVVDVQIAERDLAIASYSFRWHMVRVLATGKRVDLDVPLSRASHVFQKDEKGALRILHEHKSAAGPPVMKELPTEEPVFTEKQR